MALPATIQITRRSLLCLFSFLAISAVLDTFVAIHASTTTDESHHVDYGLQILRFEPDRHAEQFCDSQVPISALNAAPQAMASALRNHHLLGPVAFALGKYKVVRAPTIFATLGLTVFIFLWVYDLYGETAAIASCLLCTLSPSLIAHGTLATTDMYQALGIVAALYFFRRWLFQPTLGNALVSALSLALAQIAKAFAVVLYVVVCLAIAAVMLNWTSLRTLSVKRVVVFTAMAAISLLAVLNCAYCFDRTFLPVNAYHFESRMFNRLQAIPLLSHVAVPFPYPFLQGMDMMKESEDSGRSFGNTYLLGMLGDTSNPAFHGFKSYYAVAYFYKEPIALQILFIWGLIWIARNRSVADFVTAEGLLIAAAAVLVVWMSFFSRAQIGIRHILPALAIEIIVAAAAFSSFLAKSWPQKAVLCLLALWFAVSTARYYPAMIPYMNEWAGDRRFTYRLLSDSNLDWGQDQPEVDKFLAKNPNVIVDPARLMAGRILVRANRLTGVYRWDSATYIAARYQPVAQVGYAHFLFVIPAQDAASDAPKHNASQF